ncbi:hypothetical protein GCM10028796_37120 [Ramlibacter monticola]|uniref:Uncharacterized protein n=1 Tax=Ramlibacter monticola TaxID=1926872 RepID=A0A936Z7V8_9BURK|nr:hypothetical protein [Ramlibacter monticola]MBL0394597.1 hypothetical protein [Ramlibacter monticola]
MVQQKKREQPSAPERLKLAAMGLEAEFSLVVDGEPMRPEDLFGSPRDFIRGELMHRQGRSYHLPTGGAVYFDTGVIEVATPVVEIARGCAARAGRSLWEAIQFVRGELDAWDAGHGRETRLVGFSAHYNVSFELPPGQPANGRSIEKLALLLTYILPAPVMLLAANRRSTGVGVRPRKDRIEITCDFTPSPALTIATAALIVGVVREVMTWPSYELGELSTHGIPVIRGFRPMPHTSRKGWLARFNCYPKNPFTCDIDREMWQTERDGELSLRAIAGRAVRLFLRPVRRLSDPFTFRLIGSVLRGRSPSLLDQEDRPEEYEHVGRLCAWDGLSPPAQLARSRYERVVIRAVSGQQLRRNGHSLRPVGMSGWSAVVFRREDDRREVIAIDDLIQHLDQWERSR